jgi:hypothetical protein
MKRFGRTVIVAAVPAMTLLGCPFSGGFIEGTGGVAATSSSSGSSTTTQGSGGMSECTKDSECDDGNVCTKDTCNAGHKCAHINDDSVVPKPSDPCNTYTCKAGVQSQQTFVGQPCGPDPLKCNQDGLCAGCKNASQCPTEDCRSYTCDAQEICQHQDLPQFMALPASKQQEGDCRVLQCDGSGAVVSAVDVNDTPPDPNDCTKGGCGITGDPAYTYLPYKASCASGSGTFCDGSGQCIGCGDTSKDGQETDTDCGGPDCPACADGKGCKIGQDCVSKVCKTNACQPPACTDGFPNGTESDTDCGGSCPLRCADMKKCNSGTDCTSKVCTGSVCQVPTCMDGQQNGMEAGVDCGGLCVLHCDGATCANDGDCKSGICSANYCRTPNGSLCTNDFSCASNLCINGSCVACSSSNKSQCKSGECVGGGGGICKAPLGAPCDADAQCKSGVCTIPGNLCKLASGSCAADAECFSNRCSGTPQMCQFCSGTANCGGFQCVGAICLLPVGGYCTLDSQCNSNMCAPPLCK